MNGFKEKFIYLVREPRTAKERLLLSLLIAFSAVFTFYIFGILDLTISNSDMLPFGFADLVWPVILTGVPAFILLALFFVLMRGKFFDFFISIAAGTVCAGYLQGNFMNLNLGQLTGDAILWNHYSYHAVINLLIWMTIPAILLIVSYFSKKVWKTAMILLSVLLIGMQAAGLISSAFTSDLSSKASPKYLSEQGIYELSEQDNIIVFLLDRLDGKYIDLVKEKDPDFFNSLDGFTYFPNHTALYCRTYPSAAYMLTGKPSYYETPGHEFLTDAWKNSTFIPDLRKKGFTTKLYLPGAYAYSDISQLEGLADNIAEGKIKFDMPSVLQKMINFSAYRYAPHALKPSFWFSSDTFRDVAIAEGEWKPYQIDDYAFHKNMMRQGLCTQKEKSAFVFYHLNGCHSLLLDENAEIASKPDIISQTKAAFKIVTDFMQRMKARGLYKNATIIITGDHGVSNDTSSITRPSTTALFVKPKGSAGIPPVISDVPVSHENFQPTVIKAAEIQTEAYGSSVFEVSPDANLTRKFFYRLDDRKTQTSLLEEFEIKGDARVFDNWKKVGERNIRYVYG